MSNPFEQSEKGVIEERKCRAKELRSSYIKSFASALDDMTKLQQLANDTDSAEVAKIMASDTAEFNTKFDTLIN